jgi:pSer/pThr/pTyr-binding forkhead associated (FHA) protein
MSSRPPDAHLAPAIGQDHPTILVRSPGVLIGRGRDAERDEAAEAGLDYAHVGWPQVSAKHCRIVKVDHEWYLEQDATSKNGVYHNNAPLPIGPGPDRRAKLAPHIHLVHEVSTIARTVRVSHVFQLGQPAAAPVMV